MGAKRVTLTRKANGRCYLGMDEAAARALVVMIGTAVHYQWQTDCMGHDQPEDVREAGRRISYAAPQIERLLQDRDNRTDGGSK